MKWFGRRKNRVREIAPGEIFLDSSNLPSHNKRQFEGRVARPVSMGAIWGVGVTFALAVLAFSMQAYNLQITQGERYTDISRNNRLNRTLVFAARGVIYDRNGLELAWNESLPASCGGTRGRPGSSSDYSLYFATSPFSFLQY